MATDEHDFEQATAPRPVVPRAVLMTGVAGACLLGVSAGLWARPAQEDKPVPMHVAKAAAARAGKLQIELVHDPLAPPPALKAADPDPTVIVASGEKPVVVQRAPLTPPAGLLKVTAPIAPQLLEPVRPQAAVAARPTPVVAVRAAPEAVERPVRPTAVRATPKPAPKPAEPKLVRAKAETPKKPPAKLQVAKVEPKKKSAERKIQLAEKREPARAKTGRAADAAQTEVAAARGEGRITRIKHVLAKVVPHKSKSPETAVAKAERPVRLAKAEAPKRAEKPVKAASRKCVSSDPGAAIVCADPVLGAADRQLARAYREAEAAGVSPSQLKQQQQRWLAARAAAAREAPWAVHDVYLSRIAELNDQTRDARTGY